LGSARIAADGQGGLLVSGVGPGGGDGVKVQVGQSSLVGLGLSALADAPVGSFLDLHAESATTTLSGRLQHEADSWSFVPDPDAQGAADSQVQIFDADRHLVGTFPGGSDTVHFDSPPQGIIIQGFDRPLSVSIPTRIVLLSSAIPPPRRWTANTDFAVTREQLGIGGFAATALGGTTVDESASGLRLSNLGAGSGVALGTGRTATAHVFFAPIDPSGASTRLRAGAVRPDRPAGLPL